GWRHPGVNDSKQVDCKQREALASVIKLEAVAWCVAFAEPQEIDAINIYHAGLLAMQRAVEGLAAVPQELLIDARRIKALEIPQRKIVRGDELSISIAAASILAKTTRDSAMTGYDQTYPGYGFAQHKGYPVKEHFAALARLGPCPIHRRSFEPVRRVLDPAGEAGMEAGKVASS
ncbi:MAG TPA: ribonuclease HII, partial [Polyangiaceae bacterium]|nr:ribonuclease HII [Polyangiaceae bacterium]